MLVISFSVRHSMFLGFTLVLTNINVLVFSIRDCYRHSLRYCSLHVFIDTYLQVISILCCYSIQLISKVVVNLYIFQELKDKRTKVLTTCLLNGNSSSTTFRWVVRELVDFGLKQLVYWMATRAQPPSGEL